MANEVLYGYHNLQDLASERVTGSLIPVVTDALQQAVAEHNRQLDSLMSLFVERTTNYSERYKQVGAARLQPMDDDGRARPIKPAGYYDVAFPLQAGGSAWGANYVTRAKMTVADVARQLDMMLLADNRWLRDHILGALFQTTAWTFTDPLFGALTIQPLANGDGTLYNIIAGNDAGLDDTHQLGQAGAINVTNPYPTIYAELIEHPENGGKVISFIPTGLRATTEALATFMPTADQNVRIGADSNVLIGSLGVAVPGTVLGYETSGVWIVEWPQLPANYIVAVTTEGPRPVAMREDPEPELRGFKMVAERPDYPFWEAQWLRRAGFGIRNRVGAVVMEISDASYDIPTGYTTPMP